MTFNEIFEQISNESGLEYKHCTVEGRIKDICDFYGVDTRGKTLTMALRELLQIKDTSCNLYSFLLTQLMNLVVTKWYDIVIDESPEVVNTADGQLKVVQVMGNCYQAEETNLVPTPDRPIPIISKKVKAGDSYVELRSLKETSNLFDKNIMAFTSGTLKSDGIVGTNVSYAVSGFVPVEPSTQYTIKVIDGFRGSTKVYYDINKQLISNESIVTFTTPSNCYFVRWQTATTDTRVLTEEDIQKINDEMMMVKGNSLPSSYVAPTVRDYKIVDHQSKTAKIIRNVKNIDLSLIGYQYQTGIDDKPYRIANYLYNLTSINDSYKYIYANSEKVYNYDGFKSQMENGLCVSEHGIMRVVNDVTNADELKTYIDNNHVDILYALATPTEETIPYLEDDTSEVGLSWQDKTSPSPGVPSEIYEVTDLNIKTTGKNLFDANKSKKGLYLNNQGSEVIYDEGFSVSDYIEITQNEKICINPLSNSSAAYVCFYNQEKNLINGYANSVVIAQKGVLNIPENAKYIRFSSRNIELIQVEFSSVATPYQEYQESSITHHLAKPLRATKDGSVRDVIDVVKGITTYNLIDFVVDDKTIISLGTSKEKTQVFQVNQTPFVGSTNKNNMFCEKLINDSGKDEELFACNGAIYVGIDKKRLEEVSVAGFKKWLIDNPLKFIGQSRKPTTEPLEAELVEKLKQLKTFSPVTYIWVEGLQPLINAQVKLEVYDRTKLKGGG